MNTINDVLHYLNVLNFAGYMKNGDFEKNKQNKKVLTDEI